MKIKLKKCFPHILKADRDRISLTSGGGGYACISGHGAGSGYPKYTTRDISADGTRVLVTVGIRGYDTSHCDGGETRVRMISPTQDITEKTGGGGR